MNCTTFKLDWHAKEQEEEELDVHTYLSRFPTHTDETFPEDRSLDDAAEDDHNLEDEDFSITVVDHDREYVGFDLPGSPSNLNAAARRLTANKK